MPDAMTSVTLTSCSRGDNYDRATGMPAGMTPRRKTYSPLPPSRL
jgi:hypothetical protein